MAMEESRMKFIYRLFGWTNYMTWVGDHTLHEYWVHRSGKRKLVVKYWNNNDLRTILHKS